MSRLYAEYLAAGANRFSATADWDETGVLAFGSDTNIALWRPHDLKSKGIYTILSGHKAAVNVVRFLPKSKGVVLSGAGDSTIKIWTKHDKLPRGYACIQTLTDHEKSINCLTAVGAVNIFASGSADGTVKMWSLDDQYMATLRQTIPMTPRFIPLALALNPLTGAPKSYVLAVAGTIDIIQLYVLDYNEGSEFKLTATLRGHENWIRSLDFTRENDQPFSDIILSSASQDKYIRLWRIHQGQDLPPVAASIASPTSNDENPAPDNTASIKAKSPAPSSQYSAYRPDNNESVKAKSPAPSSQYSAYRPGVAASEISKPPGSPYVAFKPGILRTNSEESTSSQVTITESRADEYESVGSPLSPKSGPPESISGLTPRPGPADPISPRSGVADSVDGRTPRPGESVNGRTPRNAVAESAGTLTSSSVYEPLRPGKPPPRVPSRAGTVDSNVTSQGKALSNKAYRFKAQGLDFSLTFEALLLGHEDWIWSAKWCFTGAKLQLLSASADNSLAIWEPDPTTGVWITVARLGEISAEKGATTATGSTGGFWTGLWSPSGESVACLGLTGSWRIWHYNPQLERWAQSIGVSGHTRSVTAIAWQRHGDYLLSTSIDKSTRLHSQWKRGTQNSWHEMARPQIHGYDLNCIDTLRTSEFVSGADEKSLRVFNEPKTVAKLYRKLGGVTGFFSPGTPAAASVPVLGLSNKAIEEVEDEDADSTYGEGQEPDRTSGFQKSTLDLDHPPLEDHLSRHTLWPEGEKLYGHGHELSALACSHDGSLIATACKATSIDHAVIILFKTDKWKMVQPALVAHNLTVTGLRFSPDDRYLLSVGRDRQWTVFERDIEDPDLYQNIHSNTSGHSRMILDCAWAPTSHFMFATAGRDKLVKVWSYREDVDEGYGGGPGDDVEQPEEDETFGEGPSTPTASKQVECVVTITHEHAVTAIDFYDTAPNNDQTYFAAGTESGRFRIYSLAIKDDLNPCFHVEIPLVIALNLFPSKQINQISWRPAYEDERGKHKMELAVASEDCSVRIYRLQGCPDCLPKRALFMKCCGAKKVDEEPRTGLGITNIPY